MYWSLTFTKKKSATTLYFIKMYQKKLLDSDLVRYILREDKSSHRRCSVRKGVLRNFVNSLENTCATVFFLIKLQAPCNFIKKETLAQVFSCDFCEISKNTFFTEHLHATFFYYLIFTRVDLSNTTHWPIWLKEIFDGYYDQVSNSEISISPDLFSTII